MSTKVMLYVYDLSQGMARSMSLGLMGQQIDAIYHTSVVVFGREFYYGQGIMSAIPETTMHGRPMERIDMGETEIPQEIFMEFMDNMRHTFTAEAYHLLDNNCNNFSNELCNFLVGQPIPSRITSLPADFLNTPLGQTMRPMIEGMFGPSRHTPSPAPSTLGLFGTESAIVNSTHNQSVPSFTSLDALRAVIRNNTAVVVYFTSATCPPCRVIAPVFEELVLSKGENQIKGAKVDLSVAYQIGQAFEVRSTPTFVFYLRGEKFSQFSGANQAELRSSIDLLIYSAHPPHPHSILRLDHYAKLSGVPILFPSLDTVDTVFSKLGTFLQAVKGLDSGAGSEAILNDAETKQLDKIQQWLKKRDISKKNKTQEPTLGELGPTWKPLINKLINTLPYENLFPVLDIMRMLVLHPRISEVYAKDGNLTLVSVFKTVAEKDDAHPGGPLSKAVTLLSLRLACNSFGTPVLSTYMLSPGAARESTKQLLITTLLSPVPQIRQTAASLAFDIGMKLARARDPAPDSTGPTPLTGKDDLDEDWKMECLSAIANAIVQESHVDSSSITPPTLNKDTAAKEREEILYRLVASIANFIYKDDPATGAVLLSVLTLPETLDSLIKEHKVVQSKNVIGLCQEVQEMIRTAAESQGSRV
ncbi:hypothetical protein BGW38_007545 [Lunasporangiospora selenospora]|uniref:Thioredoxin n=1 Tax=Lunasporangiospora selenospora TaxID=979761 RepID=A0A9P6G437_9FUNG|nr:hypothetical protein BGW38_007545 [Lunasporangiospora selenospora]